MRPFDCSPEGGVAAESDLAVSYLDGSFVSNRGGAVVENLRVASDGRFGAVRVDGGGQRGP